MSNSIRTAIYHDSDLATMEKLVTEEKRKLRDDTIEECARVADALSQVQWDNPNGLRNAAAAIRALKDKP